MIGGHSAANRNSIQKLTFSNSSSRRQSGIRCDGSLASSCWLVLLLLVDVPVAK